MDPMDRGPANPGKGHKKRDSSTLNDARGISDDLSTPRREAGEVPPPPPMMRLGSEFVSLVPDINAVRWIWQLPEWPAFEWDMARIAGPLAAARQAQGRLQMAGRVLDPDLTIEALAQVLRDEGMSTSAIEGETLNPESVAASVARHLGIPLDRSLNTQDVDGLIGVLRAATESRDVPISQELLCSWQSSLFPGGRSSELRRITTGALRPGEVIVAHGRYGDETVDFAGVPREHLEPQLERFIQWFNESRSDMDGLIRAGVTHLWFVTLHPFDDGNGRMTRALTDMAVAQDWGPSECLFRMSRQILAVRKDYYAALKGAQSVNAGMDLTPWLEWFLHQVAAACATAEKTIMHVLAKAKFWAEHKNHDLNDRQLKVLNKLLDTEPGQYEGGMSKRKYAAIADCPKITASRDLTDLFEKGYLVPLTRDELDEAGIPTKKPLGGRSRAYDIPWERLLA